MKKKIIIIASLVFLLIIGLFSFKVVYENIKVKNANVEVILKDDLAIDVFSKVKLSSFIESINGKIIDDYFVDTTTIGNKKIGFTFINNENIKLNYSFDIEVVDNVPPVIWLSSSYQVKVGSNDTLLQDIMCGDNYDSKPNCFIEGDYNLDKEGKYKLLFKAIDSSNNESKKKFTLNVYKASSGTGGSTTLKKETLFSDVVKKHKNENTKIGIDVSEWQGDIDFEALKDAGVEFIFIRVGGTKGREGDYFLDSTFKENIKKANSEGISVGVYFFSYATSTFKARENALWVLEQIKGYDVELPIVFDWENWDNFNKYEVSFYELTNMANTFIDTVEKAGYKGMLYSSKSYLEKIWMPNDNFIWLAHYTDKTNYEGNYNYWQLCSDGKVNGINGYVDINVMYEGR